MNRSLTVFLLPILLAGCAHKINYPLTEQDRWTGPTIQKVLVVRPFKDETVAITNSVEYTVRSEWHTNHNSGMTPKTKPDWNVPSTNVVHREISDEWRTNYRGGYDNKDLGLAVGAMVAKHLAHSGLFNRVEFGTNATGDYTLTGTLTEYSVRALANETAEGIKAGTAGFGLLGAVVGSVSTSGMTSQVRVMVKIDNLTLATREGEAVWQNNLVLTNNFTAHYTAADPIMVFQHPDDGLKTLVTGLIRELGASTLTNRIEKTAEK
ncbi:MAG: hypothetical protein U1F98_11365 [Verrucomicrobiota bacterium]